MKKLDTQKLSWFTKLFNSPNIAILVMDKVRQQILINRQFTKMFGYREEELLHAFSDRHSPLENSFEQFIAQAADIVDNGQPVEIDYQFRHRDGTLFWGHVTGDRIIDTDETIWTVIDITPRVRLQEELLNKKQQLQAINELIHLGTWELDLKSRQLYISKEMRSILHIGSDESFNYRSIIKMIHPDDKVMLKEVLRERFDKTAETRSSTLRFQRDDGVRHLFIQAKLTYDTMGASRSIIGATLDVTDQKGLELKLQQQNELVSYQSYHDTLTGLPNRLLLTDRLNQMIANSRRNKTLVAVLFIDLDDFKSLNDALGHTLGDEFLVKIAKRMKSKIRASDTLARLSGDVFVIVLDEIESIEVLGTIIDNGLRLINTPIEIDGKSIYPKMSIGVSIYPNDGQDCDTLLKNADAAMHKAKADGGHTYSFYDSSLTLRAFERIGMEQSLKNAIKEDELLLHYQPQIDAQNNRLIGMEALVRWEHPTKGLIMPGEFIPMAEEVNLIIELNYWVIETAVKQHAAWYKEGREPGILAINLAVRQLEEQHSFRTIHAILKKHECLPEWLEFEITEGQLMQKPKAVITALQKFRDIGIEIAIDDFGTGYSSLSYLKHLPIDKLKIDKSFVDNLPDDRHDVAIAKTVIGLSDNLDLKVIAEGVETQEQLDFLLANGCHNIQGYFYSRPLPTLEIEHFMQRYQQSPHAPFH